MEPGTFTLFSAAAHSGCSQPTLPRRFFPGMYAASGWLWTQVPWLANCITHTLRWFGNWVSAKYKCCKLILRYFCFHLPFFPPAFPTWSLSTKCDVLVTGTRMPNELEMCIWDSKSNVVGKIHKWKDNVYDWKADTGKHVLFGSRRSKG